MREGGYSHRAISHPGIAIQEMLQPEQCRMGRRNVSTSTLAVPHVSDTLWHRGTWPGSPAGVVCEEEPPTVQTIISNSAF